MMFKCDLAHFSKNRKKSIFLKGPFFFQADLSTFRPPFDVFKIALFFPWGFFHLDIFGQIRQLTIIKIIRYKGVRPYVFGDHPLQGRTSRPFLPSTSQMPLQITPLRTIFAIRAFVRSVFGQFWHNKSIYLKKI